jgi:hypothetical protein
MTVRPRPATVTASVVDPGLAEEPHPLAPAPVDEDGVEVADAAGVDGAEPA